MENISQTGLKNTHEKLRQGNSEKKEKVPEDEARKHASILILLSQRPAAVSKEGIKGRCAMEDIVDNSKLSGKFWADRFSASFWFLQLSWILCLQKKSEKSSRKRFSEGGGGEGGGK